MSIMNPKAKESVACQHATTTLPPNIGSGRFYFYNSFFLFRDLNACVEVIPRFMHII